MVRTILWSLMVAVMMYGCKEAQPAGPGTDDIVIYEVKTDVNPDRVFLVRGANLYTLSDVGYVVCYGRGHGDIRIPMKIVFGETSFSCILPDSVRSGRVKVVDGAGKALMDTVLRIYGGYSNELARLPVDLVWNQSIQVKGNMMPVLVDQNMFHHALVAHPSKPGTWLVPHRTGSCRWVVYDTTTQLYLSARTLVKIPRPKIDMVGRGADVVVVVKDYLPLETEKIKLISAQRIYEQETYWNGGDVAISMAGVDAGRYRVGVGDSDDYREFDGEVVIDDPLEGDGKPRPTSIDIKGRHQVVLETVSVTSANGETDVDTNKRADNIPFSCSIEQCTLERVSKNVFRVSGQAWAAGSVIVSGTIMRDSSRLTTDLIITEENLDRTHMKRHLIKLRKRPYTTNPDGFVEVVIGDEDFVRTGEYYYDGLETVSTQTYTQERVTKVISGGGPGNGLVLKVRL